MQAYDEYPGKIVLVYHPYPTQPLSESIAVALEAAGQQGKFWEFHNLLIRDDPADISALVSSAMIAVSDMEIFVWDTLEMFAEEAGLDMDQYQTLATNQELLYKVRNEHLEATAVGIRSASVFINGQKYDKSHSTQEEFFLVIDKELERLKEDGVD